MTYDGTGHGGTGQGGGQNSGQDGPDGGGLHAPYGGHDPYGAYGWGGGWHGWPPPPPRPGVIPLGPLDLGSIFSGAFATVGRYWKQLLPVALVAYVPAALLVAVTALILFTGVGTHLAVTFTEPSELAEFWASLRPLLLAFLALWALSIVASSAATALIQAACPAIVQEAVLGRPVSFGTVLRRAWSRLLPVLGALVLASVIALAPLVLTMAACTGAVFAYLTGDGTIEQLVWMLPLALLAVFAVIPLTVWLWVRFSLAPAAIVIESLGPVAGLRRSVALVRGGWWRIFGISVLAALMAGAAGMVLQQLGGRSGVFGGLGLYPGNGGVQDPAQVFSHLGLVLLLSLITSVIGQIVTAVFPQLVLNLLYVDQRIRGENLAPSLIHAAGLS
ncbi:hypothetical protein AB0O07_11035 [Streptomyces sp. NPDC093085]|uniref:DUF7847 domain-containing protein n=1 Tax=Streptomyces sp. NPDC093085 TaxID=3155068 RepID=UPI0034163D8B